MSWAKEARQKAIQDLREKDEADAKKAAEDAVRSAEEKASYEERLVKLENEAKNGILSVLIPDLEEVGFPVVGPVYNPSGSPESFSHLKLEGQDIEQKLRVVKNFALVIPSTEVISDDTVEFQTPRWTWTISELCTIHLCYKNDGFLMHYRETGGFSRPKHNFPYAYYIWIDKNVEDAAYNEIKNGKYQISDFMFPSTFPSTRDSSSRDLVGRLSALIAAHTKLRSQK